MFPVPARFQQNPNPATDLSISYAYDIATIVLEIYELANIVSCHKVCTRIVLENCAHLTTPDRGRNAPPTLHTGWMQDVFCEHLTPHSVWIYRYVHKWNHTIRNVRDVMEKIGMIAMSEFLCTWFI